MKKKVYEIDNICIKSANIERSSYKGDLGTFSYDLMGNMSHSKCITKM